MGELFESLGVLKQCEERSRIWPLVGSSKKELNRGRWEVRAMKAFRAQDAVEVGFPGARTIIRTYREVWQTRKIGKKDKHGRDVRKCVGKPTTEKAACNDIARGDGWRTAASA